MYDCGGGCIFWCRCVLNDVSVGSGCVGVCADCMWRCVLPLLVLVNGGDSA